MTKLLKQNLDHSAWGNKGTRGTFGFNTVKTQASRCTWPRLKRKIATVFLVFVLVIGTDGRSVLLQMSFLLANRHHDCANIAQRETPQTLESKRTKLKGAKHKMKFNHFVALYPGFFFFLLLVLQSHVLHQYTFLLVGHATNKAHEWIKPRAAKRSSLNQKDNTSRFQRAILVICMLQKLPSGGEDPLTAWKVALVDYNTLGLWRPLGFRLWGLGWVSIFFLHLRHFNLENTQRSKKKKNMRLQGQFENKTRNMQNRSQTKMFHIKFFSIKRILKRFSQSSKKKGIRN